MRVALWSIALCSLVLASAVLSGCGSSGTAVGPPGPGPEPAHTFTIGPLQVGTAAAAGFQTLTLDTPASAPVGFTVLYGSKIVRLREMGYGKIAFSSDRDGDDEIYVMNSDGLGQWTRLTWNRHADIHPTWSPGGDRIAFASDRHDNWEIYRIDADGSGVIRLTNTAATDSQPAWSPAGGKIAFVSDRRGNPDIWVMDSDGASPTRLTTDGANDEWPTWSPDGRQIAFASDRRNGNWDIYVMNADGSGQTRITANPMQEIHPAWSADGLRIAFASEHIIGVMDSGGAHQTQLTRSPTEDRFPAWSPDDRKLAFSRRVGTEHNIFMTDADGRDPRNLTASDSNDYRPAWCPAVSARRTLVGPAGSDGGENPPFGTQRPLAVAGVNADGLVSAATIGVDFARWGSIKVAALSNLGGELAGMKVVASKINNVQEDLGRGLSPRTWDLTGWPKTGAALVLFSAEKGKVVSVVASADTALDTASTELTVELSGGRLILQGSFTAVYDATRTGTDALASAARRVVLDRSTGRVLALE